MRVQVRRTEHNSREQMRALRAGRAAIFGVIAMVLGGCALLIAEPPASGIDPPAQYRRPPPGRNSFVPAPDWWRAFKSAELDNLVERALAQNHDIGVALARIDQALAQLRISEALLLPTGGFTGTRSSMIASGAALDLPDRLPSTHLHHIDITASYEIDFWGKNAALIRASDQTALASQYNRDVVELTVISTLLNTYFDLLATTDRLRIAEENLRLATRIRAVIKQRLDAGSSTSIDLVQQDYVVSQLRSTIPQLRSAARQDVFALAALLGELPETIEIRSRTLSRAAAPVVSPGLPSDLILQRPDIRHAEFQLSAAAANLASARVALLPRFSLTGTRGYESSMLKTLITPQALIYNVAANVTEPIFEMPRLLAEVELQKAKQRELLETYRQSIIQGFTDVERALVAVREAAETERLTRQSLAIGQRGYQLSETQLSAGNVDLTTMLNIQRTLFQAQDDLALARLTRFQAIVSLYRALGGGWMENPIPLNEGRPQPPPEDAAPPASKE